MADGAVQKVEVDLPAAAIDYLRQQAGERGVTPTEVLISALGTDQFIRSKATARNSDVVVVENGKRVKLVF